MKFTDHFLKEDKSKALMYRKNMMEQARFANELSNIGKFDQAEMYAAQFLRLIGELRRMAINKTAVDQAHNDLRQVTDDQIRMIRDQYHA